MRVTRDPPDAWRLFYTVLVAAGAAWLIMVGMVGWLWLVADPDEDPGLLLYIVELATVIFGLAVAMHYPWGPRRVAATGGTLASRPSGRRADADSPREV